tara:strand:- start:6063 stop:6542 length:480 start_codon:yes stop_codon:yes gene_type:complete
MSEDIKEKINELIEAIVSLSPNPKNERHDEILEILTSKGLFFGGSSGKGLDFTLSTGDPDEPNGYWYYKDSSYTGGKDITCDCKINDLSDGSPFTLKVRVSGSTMSTYNKTKDIIANGSVTSYSPKTDSFSNTKVELTLRGTDPSDQGKSGTLHIAASW